MEHIIELNFGAKEVTLDVNIDFNSNYRLRFNKADILTEYENGNLLIYENQLIRKHDSVIIGEIKKIRTRLPTV